MLTVTPNSNMMYGYCTGEDATGATIYGPWILAKKSGADDGKVGARLDEAAEMLRQLTVTL